MPLMSTLCPIFRSFTVLSVNGVLMRIISSMVSPLKHGFLVAITMALDIDGDGQTGDMGRIGLDMDIECRHPAAKSHGTDSQPVDLLQEFFFEPGHLRVRMSLPPR